MDDRAVEIPHFAETPSRKPQRNDIMWMEFAGEEEE